MQPRGLTSHELGLNIERRVEVPSRSQRSRKPGDGKVKRLLIRQELRFKHVELPISTTKVHGGRITAPYELVVFKHVRCHRQIQVAFPAQEDARAERVRLATATLNRFLHSVEQPQIFGAQYRKKGSEPWTQEPFNQTILSDAIRALFKMSPLSRQRDRLEEMNRAPRQS